ncbi:MAG: NUDIX hydrolase [Flexilinea sp.]
METEIIGSEKKYHAHVFDVSKLQVRLPNGKIRNYDLVEHVPAVVIIPVTSDGNILFVWQFRMGANKQLLELPAGILNGENGSEDPKLAAERECREETGFESKEIKRIGGFYMTPGYCTEYIHIFLAKNLNWNPLPQDDDEFLNTEALTIEEAYRRAETAEFEDVKTIAALMMAQKEIRSWHF